MFQFVREGRWLTAARVRGYAFVLLGFELLGFAVCVAGTHGWLVPLSAPTSSDFVSFYAAGSLADAGTPALAYDHAAHYAREQAATEPGIAYNFFFYPPPFLLFCAVLARMPYIVAFTACQIATLLPCLLMARRVIGPSIGPLLAFPPVFWTVGTGQNAGLTAGLLAGGLLLLQRRPLIAGLLMGAVCYKPHLFLLVPLALLAGGYWRALAGAALSVAGLIAVSAAVFGADTWWAWLASSAGAPAVFAAHDTSIDLAGITSSFGLALALGAESWVAATAQVLTVAALGGLVVATWRSSGRDGPRNAVLLAAIPLAAPVGMFYDLLLVGFAMVWMVRDGRVHGFPAWQRSGLFVLFVLPLFSGNTGFSTQIGIPPLCAALAVTLAARQAWSERSAMASTSSEPLALASRA